MTNEPDKMSVIIDIYDKAFYNLEKYDEALDKFRKVYREIEGAKEEYRFSRELEFVLNVPLGFIGGIIGFTIARELGLDPHQIPDVVPYFTIASAGTILGIGVREFSGYLYYKYLDGKVDEKYSEVLEEVERETAECEAELMSCLRLLIPKSIKTLARTKTKKISTLNKQ